MIRYTVKIKLIKLLNGCLGGRVEVDIVFEKAFGVSRQP